MAVHEEKYILHGPPLEYESKYTSIGKILFDQLQIDPTFVAQVEADTGHEDTNSDILNRSVRVALWLRSKGIGPGDVVSYCSDNHKDSSPTCYGTLFVGAALNTWAPVLSTREIAHLMSITKPKVVFCDEQCSETIKGAAKELNHDCIIVVYGDLQDFISFRDIIQEQSKDEIDRFQCTEVNENDVAIILCSSGTSGLAKGVAISHKALLIPYTGLAASRVGIPRTLISFSSLDWLSGLLPVFSTVAGKSKHIVTPRCDDEFSWQMIEKHRPGMALLGTSRGVHMCYSESAGKYDTSSLRVLFISGGLLAAEVQNKLKEILPNCMVSQGYGMTEVTGAATSQIPTSKPGSCGVLLPGASCKVVDPETGKTISPHTPGELCFKHPSMFLRYYNDPVQTQKVFDADGWFHSGDVGRFDEDGELFITDRLKEILKYRGHHIAPAELETILMKHPGVRNVGVVGKRVDRMEDVPVAFVVREAGSNVTEEELCDFLAKQVADVKRLRGGVRFLEEMPMTPSGKVKRNVLKEMIKAET